MTTRLGIMREKFNVLIVLLSIIVIGIIGIPYGDPRFIVFAFLLELSYIILAFLVTKGYNIPLYVCIILAAVIIIGNSFVSAHIHRIITFSRPINTIVLIIGGYILQGLLIYTSILAIRANNALRSRP